MKKKLIKPQPKNISHLHLSFFSSIEWIGWAENASQRYNSFTSPGLKWSPRFINSKWYWVDKEWKKIDYSIWTHTEINEE